MSRLSVTEPHSRPTDDRAAVLVVEDEYLIRVMIADELRSSGLQVVECSCADQALEVLHAGVRISVVFTDVRMPGSIDGQALAHLITETFPALLVVLTSAQTLAGASPAIKFVPKPYDPRHVARLINDLLTGTERPAHS